MQPKPHESIKVLVVEADEAMRRQLVAWLEADSKLRVLQAVGDAQAALDYLAHNRPDAVLMDLGLPGLDGFDTTRRIMETHPLPIIVCAEPPAGDAVFRSLEAGAVACVEKPSRSGDNTGSVAYLRQTLKLMSEVKVVRRWQHRSTTPSRPSAGAACGRLGVVGIGASTGGPQVLQTILAGLPADFALPVLVVQHIARGFLPGMADWLRQTSGLKVQIAAHGMPPQPGHVYLAPDDFQMGLGRDGSIELARAECDGLCPSVGWLFESLATHCGERAIAVLLTGMGRDGAAQMRRLRLAGAVTIAQDQASSAVYGMPGEAARLGAATHVLPPERIAEKLIALAQEHAAAARSSSS